MVHQRAPLSILSCQSGLAFAKKIEKELVKKHNYDVHVIPSSQVVFANTEIKTVIDESIRGRDVYIVQDVENHTEGMSVDENLRAIYTTIDSCRRCGAERLTAILPSYPYARQDKQDGREGITAARVAWELEGEMGVNHIITIDLHNSAIQGFFRRAQIDNLRGSFLLAPYVKKLIKDPKSTLMMPTDLGGAKRANYYARYLCTNIAFTYKTRNYSKPNCVEEIAIMGDLKDKDVFIIDDMICTGGTLSKAIMEAKDSGAKSVTAICTLALFNGPAIERFSKLYEDGYLKKVIGTDATFHTKEMLKENPWFEEVTVSKYFAEVIHRINTRKSIGNLLK